MWGSELKMWGLEILSFRVKKIVLRYLNVGFREFRYLNVGFRIKHLNIGISSEI